MKKQLLALRQSLAICLVATAALTSCNRAEYAALPKTSSYHGAQYTVTAPKPASASEVTAEPVVPTPALAPVPVSTPVHVAAPTVAAAPAVATPTTAAKLNLIQKTLVNKVSKQANKVASKVQMKQKTETAETNRLSGNLRNGIILILVGLLVLILGSISNIFTILGTIIAVIGVILVVLGLLDAI